MLDLRTTELRRTRPRRAILSATLAFVAAATLTCALVPARALAQSEAPARVVVLTFEGWRADRARSAAVRALAGPYELIEEEVAVRTATEIGVDVSTPEGMAAVVEHLHVTLVIGGFVEGRARSATTTVWVMDVRGNELSRRVTSSPVGRGAASDIGDAALEAASEGIAVLTRPVPVPDPVEPVFVPEEVVERPGAIEEPVDISGRWNQPLLRALVGVRLRNRAAYVSPNSSTDRFDADIFPDIQIMVESHPLARAAGDERGLYLALSGGFSAGLQYFTLDGRLENMQVYNFDVAGGYGFIFAEVFELVASLGFGIDGFSLDNGGLGDFPSATYLYLRPQVQGRVRILDDLVLAELGFAGRIAFDSGAIQAYGPAGTSAGGIDFFVGLAGIVDPGFSWAARFAYANTFLGFSGATQTGGNDENIQIWLMVGWSLLDL